MVYQLARDTLQSDTARADHRICIRTDNTSSWNLKERTDGNAKGDRTEINAINPHPGNLKSFMGACNKSQALLLKPFQHFFSIHVGREHWIKGLFNNPI